MPVVILGRWHSYDEEPREPWYVAPLCWLAALLYPVGCVAAYVLVALLLFGP